MSKILAIDNSTIHTRMYTNTFETKPSDLDSSDLKFFIWHAPMAKEGFLLDKPELLKVEQVSEDELEGYKMYLEATSNQYNYIFRILNLLPNEQRIKNGLRH